MDPVVNSPEACNSTMSDQVHFNVGGTRFSTTWATLQRIPNSKLGRLQEGGKEIQQEHGEFFFDRNPAVFGCVLDFYRNGVLHLPETVCGRQIREELGFWDISAGLVSSCCWRVMYKDSGVDKTMAFLDTEMPLFPNGMQLIQKAEKMSSTIWNLLEYPSSSLVAKGYMLFYFVCVLLSVIPDMVDIGILHILNLANLVFLLDILIRFIMSPNKVQFIFSVINILDIIALMACIVTLIVSLVDIVFGIRLPLILLQIFGIFQMFKYIRFIRVFKASRTFALLLLAVFKSKRALLLYVSVMMVNCVFYGIIFRWFETKGEDRQNVDVAISIYWALISMTTVGYGDIYPVTTGGKVIGVLCAISGVILFTLPISVIYQNYKTLYSRNRDRENHAIDLDRYRPTLVPFYQPTQSL
ncbi:potassium voltage-gated channel protein Shaw-like [Pecten maximus]|uniref:potassium voltage-gated channel protein Shaw-like n=1 Tax=Pecten maximus TaxID=6579 RepID=UPI00145846A1|nr:potassium voltage-gated channel protein Shaw-like [Pecten maximus]